MELYIVRHGIAIDREDPKCPADPERYLTEEGVEKTKGVAKGLAALGVAPGLFLTSPYTRALQTAEIFADALDYAQDRQDHGRSQQQPSGALDAGGAGELRVVGGRAPFRPTRANEIDDAGASDRRGKVVRTHDGRGHARGCNRRPGNGDPQLRSLADGRAAGSDRRGGARLPRQGTLGASATLT